MATRHKISTDLQRKGRSKTAKMDKKRTSAREQGLFPQPVPAPAKAASDRRPTNRTRKCTPFIPVSSR